MTETEAAAVAAPDARINVADAVSTVQEVRVQLHALLESAGLPTDRFTCAHSAACILTMSDPTDMETLLQLSGIATCVISAFACNMNSTGGLG